MLSLQTFNSYKEKIKSPYFIAIACSSAATGLGIIREILIVYLLGFTKVNDELQIYLGAIFSISLFALSVRMTCLNLLQKLTVGQVIGISIPIVAGFTFLMTAGVQIFFDPDPFLLTCAATCGFLNLFVTLLITYKQRENRFLAAHLVYLVPNFVHIPMLLIIYGLSPSNPIQWFIPSICTVPLIQLALLAFIKTEKPSLTPHQKLSIRAATKLYLQHGIAALGEGLFQTVLRSAFLSLGEGYLSLLSIIIRIYEALRVILIETLVGSKLSSWIEEGKANHHAIALDSSKIHLGISALTLGLIFFKTETYIQFSVQLLCIMIPSFVFSAYLRVVYAKFNTLAYTSKLIIQFGLYNLVFVLFLMYSTIELNVGVLWLIWIWYLGRPLCQIQLVKRHMVFTI